MTLIEEEEEMGNAGYAFNSGRMREIDIQIPTSMCLGKFKDRNRVATEAPVAYQSENFPIIQSLNTRSP
jgi:hypothetical protein